MTVVALLPAAVAVAIFFGTFTIRHKAAYIHLPLKH